MALKPRIVRTEEQKPEAGRTESSKSKPDAKPRVVSTEEQKPKKPTSEN